MVNFCIAWRWKIPFQNKESLWWYANFNYDDKTVIRKSYHHNVIPTPLKYLSDDVDDVIKWKHFPHYWPFVRGIDRWPVHSPHKGQWRWALMSSLICNRDAGDLRRHRAHYAVIVMWYWNGFHHSCQCNVSYSTIGTCLYNTFSAYSGLYIVYS